MKTEKTKIIQCFEDWMGNYTSLSETSIPKYVRGFRVTEKEMLERGVITKNLTAMSLSELDLVIQKIFNDAEFTAKNKRGNHMYSCALKQYRSFLFSQGNQLENVIADVLEIRKNTELTETEKNVMTKARIGQGEFRDKLFQKYDSKCIISGITVPQVLIASHVKPWAVSSSQERISTENGLLLSATYDRLFDSGLISFKGDGTIMLSNDLRTEELTRLHLQKGTKFKIKASAELKMNLEYHRDTIYINHKRVS